MTNKLYGLMVPWSLLLATSVWAAIPSQQDDFEAYGNGTAVSTLANWGASSSAVQVTNETANSGSRSFVMPERESASNHMDGAGATVVWSDYHVRPVLGLPPGAPPTNTASYCQYFDTNGYVVVYTPTGTPVQSLGYRAWGADSNTVVVKAGQGYASDKAALLPAGTAMSNRIATAETRIWTDYHVKPSLGSAPGTNPDASFLGYVNGSGYFVVATTSGWVTCTTDITNGPLPAMSASGYTRVTVHQDFTTRLFALFV